MLIAILSESELKLSDEMIEGILCKAFKEADVDLEGKICRSEWHQFTSKNTQLLKRMTLQYLKLLDLSPLLSASRGEVENECMSAALGSRAVREPRVVVKQQVILIS
ncbi:calcineurin B-like protein 1 [Spinacia oleracea]|uniref:Calcineurin B-like protein n=1 Tax=Spinacia oleracea TaxID=3562 RepID=A0ABM3RKB2_SPIOL|nr:calcineurin B-like protein 1 [Spinacia oleracea]